MSTRQQIRLQVRSLIGEPDPNNTHFTDASLNGFIDQAVKFSASFIEYPRDFVSVQATYNIGAYTLISDNLIIRNAYFGDKNISGDIRPLVIISEETLTSLFPSWLDETSTSGNVGFPRYLIVLDRRTIYIHPRPDVSSSALGKNIILGYVYSPKQLGGEGDTPELPDPYHDLLQFYVAHLCYGGVLADPKLSKFWEGEFKDKINALKPTVEKETKQGMMWQWGNYDNVNADENTFGITFR